jgi:hypothetical protein
VPAAHSPSRPAKRFRVAADVGLAQLTLVEHALCPLDRSEALRAGSLHEVHYTFTDRHRNRKTATAHVACPFGLSPNDELYLYGLLALTFAQPEPSFDFYATPDWCLRQLGITATGNEQGKRYATFRGAVRRLAGVVYENDRFYDPVRGEHRDVAFGLLKYSLPIDPASSRAWHFVWDPQFFRFCEATAGSFQFDMELYRSLDYASRRLFLLLQKIFWRNDHSPAFDLRDLAVNALGFAPTVPTKLLKQKLCRVATTLLEKDVLTLPLHAASVESLFAKQRPGVHTVQFWRGAHFDRSTVADRKPIDSPLAEPLAALGFELPAIRRILRDYRPRLIQEWADITLAAQERKLIRQSPQAYFMHYIREAAAKRTTPPDWWREARRQEFAAERTRQDDTSADNEDREFEMYLRTEAQEAFERVTDRLFQKLKEAGQSEPDARANAENAARMHLRRSFQEARPAADRDRPSRVADILKNRWPKPGG